MVGMQIQNAGPELRVIPLSFIANLAVKRSQATIAQALTLDGPLVQQLRPTKTVDIAPTLSACVQHDLKETLAPYLDAASLQGVLNWSLPPIPLSLRTDSLMESQRAAHLASLGAAFLDVSALAAVLPIDPSAIFDLMAGTVMPVELKGLSKSAKALQSNLHRRQCAGAVRNAALRAQHLAKKAILEAFVAAQGRIA